MPNQRDKEFAQGFMAGIREALDIEEANGCPILKDIPGIGRVEGDLGCVYKDANGSRVLLIVEREGSGPGNEWNLIKWAMAAEQCLFPKVVLRTVQEPLKVVHPDRVVLVLVFGRSESWKSGFDRTIESCKWLSKVLNGHLVNLPIRIHTYIDSDNAWPVPNWEEFGRAMGTRWGRELAQV